MKKITHFVYPYIIPKDPKFGWELMYSIRSLYKFFEGEFDVTIIGEIPEWINTTAITCIKFDNSKDYNRKENRINQKILKAASMYDEFVSIHDDMYLMRPATIEDFKDHRYHQTFKDDYTSEEVLSRLKGFSRTIHNTCSKIRELGYEYRYNYVMHTPYFYETKNIYKMLLKVNMLDDSRRGYIFEQMYFALTSNKYTKTTDDYKFGMYGKPGLPTKDILFFSHDEMGYLKDNRILNYLSTNFNVACRAEKIF